MQDSDLPECPDLSEDEAHLSILATSDVHGALLAYDYYADREVKAASLARIATLLRAAWRTRPGAVLLENGDFLQGTPIADMPSADADGVTHPVITAMAHLGYDAAALGNHEFNLAPEKLRAVLAQAGFPFLCANLEVIAGADQPFEGVWRDRVILNVEARDREGDVVDVRLGVFGVLPPQVMQWDGLRLAGKVRARDMVAAARESAAQLVADGADVVVALAHTGLNDLPYEVGMENAARHIAALEEVDALVAGHVHRVFPGPHYAGRVGMDAKAGTVEGKPAVMPGAGASHLGLLDLVLAKQGGRWRVRGHGSHVIPSAGVPEDETFRDVLAPAHAGTLAATRAVVGELEAPAHSYFAMIADDRSVRIVAEALLDHVEQEVALARLEALPVLASVAPMKCGGRAGAGHYTDVAAGPIATRAIADLQIFPNHLSVLKLTGAEIVEWLEMSASLYNQLQEGVPVQLLFDRDTPAYNREAIYGLSYEIDLSQPARYDAQGRVVDRNARRVREVQFRGAPLDPEQAFLLASNEYRAGGGGHYPGSGTERIVPLAPVEIRDILTRHIQQTKGLVSSDIPSWRLRRLAGTRAVFETGAGAREVALPEGAALCLLGEGADGFVRFALDLGHGGE